MDARFYSRRVIFILPRHLYDDLGCDSCAGSRRKKHLAKPFLVSGNQRALGLEQRLTCLDSRRSTGCPTSTTTFLSWAFASA